ncbi:MAG: membrane protein insertion efficiency factor YidD [Gammaproteobacteria bacterium]|nr:membrane protein insertion efficiency factor YidD [Gammaproteobacteria bacterium]|tara:strand:+ start:1246 stop:1500 length:255 start_codon:yes stop_codon:yes gene_type:complete
MEKIEKAFIKIITLPIIVYRKCVSPYMASSCRHYPSCSSYALEAFEKNGLFLGLILTIKRIMNCRPGGTHGYDPVPGKKKHEHE